MNKLICWLLNKHVPARTYFEKEGDETYCLRCGIALLAGSYLGKPMIIVKPKVSGEEMSIKDRIKQILSQPATQKEVNKAARTGVQFVAYDRIEEALLELAYELDRIRRAYNGR